MTDISFSLRMQSADYQVLKSVAAMRKTSAAKLARGFVLDGMRNALSPPDIEHLIEERRRQLLGAAAELRQEDVTP